MMSKYVSVLDDVICLEEIKKIRIIYHDTRDYAGEWLHTLLIVYEDRTKDEYVTTDLSKAKEDYENLKSALLESVGDDHG